jgi:hypothetical protein
LLPARQGPHRPPSGLLQVEPERGHGAGIPQDLGLVAASVAPGRQCRSVGDPARLTRRGGQRPLGLEQRGAGSAKVRPGQANQQLPDGGVVADRADELSHDAEAAPDHDLPRGRLDIASNQAQQGGLPGAVGPDQRRMMAVADPEGGVLQQHTAARQHMTEMGDIDSAHGLMGRGSPKPPPAPCHGPLPPSPQFPGR